MSERRTTWIRWAVVAAIVLPAVGYLGHQCWPVVWWALTPENRLVVHTDEGGCLFPDGQMRSGMADVGVWPPVWHYENLWETGRGELLEGALSPPSPGRAHGGWTARIERLSPDRVRV